MTEPGPSYTPPPPPAPPGGGDLYGGPPAGPPPVAVAPLPWEERERLGFFPALLETLKLLITSPTEAYRRARESGDYGSPLLFAMIMIVIGTIAAGVWGLLTSMVMPAPDLSGLQDLPPNIRPFIEQLATASPASVGLQVLINMVIYFIGLFLTAGIIHLCLMLVRGTSASRAGFEGTFRVACYATASYVALLVPLVGSLIAAVWYLVLMILGLSALHHTSHGKSAAATLLPIVLCCVCGMVGIFVAIGSLASALGMQ